MRTRSCDCAVSISGACAPDGTRRSGDGRRLISPAAGIDLRRPFFFPPDDLRFDQILTQVKRERDARIARLRRDKKRFAVAKARSSRRDIAALPRVKKASYPLAGQGMG